MYESFWAWFYISGFYFGKQKPRIQVSEIWTLTLSLLTSYSIKCKTFKNFFSSAICSILDLRDVFFRANVWSLLQLRVPAYPTLSSFTSRCPCKTDSGKHTLFLLWSKTTDLGKKRLIPKGARWLKQWVFKVARAWINNTVTSRHYVTVGIKSWPVWDEPP